MKQYVKQKIKHRVKLYLTRVSVRQMKKQHSETKRSVKRKKENRNKRKVVQRWKWKLEHVTTLGTT